MWKYGCARRRMWPVEAEATLRVFDFGGVKVKTIDLSCQAPAAGALLLGRFAVDELAPERAQVFALLDLRVEGRHFRNEHVFTTWKSRALPRARVQITVEKLDSGRFQVTVTTDAPVFYLSLDSEGVSGEFDDNCFTLLPNEERELVFTSKGAAPSAQELEKALTVRHLRSTYS